MVEKLIPTTRMVLYPVTLQYPHLQDQWTSFDVPHCNLSSPSYICPPGRSEMTVTVTGSDPGSDLA